MHLYNGTGCRIVMIAKLAAAQITMPDESSESNETTIVVTRNRFCLGKGEEQAEHYRVVLSQHDAFKVEKFGHPGMRLSVRGDLRMNNNIPEIIAEEIDFVDFSNENEFEMLATLQYALYQQSGLADGERVVH